MSGSGWEVAVEVASREPMDKKWRLAKILPSIVYLLAQADTTRFTFGFPFSCLNILFSDCMLLDGSATYFKSHRA